MLGKLHVLGKLGQFLAAMRQRPTDVVAHHALVTADSPGRFGVAIAFDDMEKEGLSAAHTTSNSSCRMARCSISSESPSSSNSSTAARSRGMRARMLSTDRFAAMRNK